MILFGLEASLLLSLMMRKTFAGFDVADFMFRWIQLILPTCDGGPWLRSRLLDMSQMYGT